MEWLPRQAALAVEWDERGEPLLWPLNSIFTITEVLIQFAKEFMRQKILIKYGLSEYNDILDDKDYFSHLCLTEEQKKESMFFRHIQFQVLEYESYCLWCSKWGEKLIYQTIKTCFLFFFFKETAYAPCC